MAMQKGDLGRALTLWVDAAGCVTVQERGRGVNGSLPVFSTDTREQAEALQVRHCRLARDGSGLYFLTDIPRGVEDLGKVSDLFRETHSENLAGAAAEARNSLSDPRVRRAALDILDRASKLGE